MNFGVTKFYANNFFNNRILVKGHIAPSEVAIYRVIIYARNRIWGQLYKILVYLF